MFALVLGAASCAQDSTPSKTESSGTDINGATDNNNTNSGGTQDSTPSGSNPSGHKPSVTKPEGTDIKDVIDSEDFSGTWKLTDAYCRQFIFYSEGDTVVEYKTPEDVVKANVFFSGIEFDENLCAELSNDSLKILVAEFEEPHDIFIDWCLKVNDDNDEIYLYRYESIPYNDGVEMGAEIKLTFKKQQ